MAAEAWFMEEQEKYDYLQFVIPDVNSIPRGKIVKGKFKEKVAKDGFEVGNAICLAGPNTEPAMSIFEIIGSHFPNEEMRPCLETLTPWPWVGQKGRRVGNVLCDLCLHDGTPDLTSPRQLLKAQLHRLHERHGLVLKTAFEYEFAVYTAGSLEPLGGEDVWCWDVRLWGQHHDLFCDLTDLLEAMGVEVSSLMPEFSPGQWEITTEPQEGVGGGDLAFYIKNAVKGFFQTRGYHATFMSKPTAEGMGAGLHLNHSLWRVGGASAMLDVTQDDRMSQSAKHWLAGVLHHAPAITALCCPTLNCYRRLFELGSPDRPNWGVDDRHTMVRVHTARDNVYLENRLPSGACSPYLAMAATVAAGLDGLERKLQCPPSNADLHKAKQLKEKAEALPQTPEKAGALPQTPEKAGALPQTSEKAGAVPQTPEKTGAVPQTPEKAGALPQTPEKTGAVPQTPEKAGEPAKIGELPKTLAEALDALEKDTELRGLLGERFVDCYVRSKREYEVKRYENAELHTEAKQLEFERKMYMKNL